jgi:hypothetical protein
MTETQSVKRILTHHFFRRFFDSDTVQVEGETLTTVIRAIATVATPGLICAFFLQNQYPGRSVWGAIQDQYFFVLFSFVVMGAVAIFEWEMLFPDRSDFLILTPLPLKPLQMLATKAAALIAFLAIFLVSCNLFGALILPAITRHTVVVRGHVMFVGSFWRQLYAHECAVGLAGLFAALFFLALGGLMLCVLGAARFRMLSPLVQMFSMTAIVLLMLQYFMYSDSLQKWLTEPLGIARWMPPLWFLGLYERLLHGGAAPPFAREMARYAVAATLASAAVVFLTYPLAWAQMRRMAIEGSSRSRRRPSPWWTALIHRVLWRPGERAVFHFIGQTIARNNRYQVYLAMYCGSGLALAIACAVVFRTTGHRLQPALSQEGLHAVMPLLLFWVIAGLRAAFAFPTDLHAGWVFRVTGASARECANAGRRWVLMCAWGVMCCVLAALRLAGWDPRRLLVQLAFGLCLCILLTDAFLAFDKGVPFNHPRMPGTKSLPLMLTLYVGVLPPALFGIIRLQMHYETDPLQLLPLALGVAALHLGLARLQTGPEEIEEEMEGYEGEFQVLGLS